MYRRDSFVDSIHLWLKVNVFIGLPAKCLDIYFFYVVHNYFEACKPHLFDFFPTSLYTSWAHIARIPI